MSYVYAYPHVRLDHNLSRTAAERHLRLQAVSERDLAGFARVKQRRRLVA